MSKFRPLALKREANEVYAAKFGRKVKKSTKRKLRHERVIARQTAHLISLGVDPTESEAPIA